MISDASPDWEDIFPCRPLCWRCACSRWQAFHLLVALLVKLISLVRLLQQAGHGWQSSCWQTLRSRSSTTCVYSSQCICVPQLGSLCGAGKGGCVWRSFAGGQGPWGRLGCHVKVCCFF